MINNKSQLTKLFTLLGISLIISVILISALWYSVDDVDNSFQLEFPANESTVPNHFTNLNVTINITGGLDIKIFANDNAQD